MPSTTELHELLRRRPSSSGGSSALSQLLQRPPSTMGVDFMAFERGRRARREADFEDAQQQMWMQEIAQHRQDASDRRQAQGYLASMLGNLQQATAAGVPVSEFLVQQLDQVMEDQAFQNFSPTTQQLILQRLGQTASARADRLYNAGQFDAAQMLADRFGFVGPNKSFDRFRSSADPMALVRQLAEQNPDAIEITPEGTVLYMGEEVDPSALAFNVLQSGQAAGAWQIPAQRAWDREVQAQTDILMGRTDPTAERSILIGVEPEVVLEPDMAVGQEPVVQTEPEPVVSASPSVPQELLDFQPPGGSWQSLLAYRDLASLPEAQAKVAEDIGVDVAAFSEFDNVSRGDIRTAQRLQETLKALNQSIESARWRVEQSAGRGSAFRRWLDRGRLLDIENRAKEVSRRLERQLGIMEAAKEGVTPPAPYDDWRLNF